MASPYTAVNAQVNIVSIEKLFNDIITSHQLCQITLLSNGGYGFVFSFLLPESIENPCKTFTIGKDNTIIFTSTSNYLGTPVNAFCCKLVLITEKVTEIKINGKIMLTTTTEMSFYNECHKQRQIYAMTNVKLNSICLPLFFYGIIDPTIDGRIIDLIFSKCSISTPTGTKLRYGISIMPLSSNVYTSSPLIQPTIAPGTSTQNFVTDDIAIESMIDSIRIYLDYEMTEEYIIRIFLSSQHILSFISVLSLVVRLYSVGYCHGDLHFKNIVVNPTPSGIIVKHDTHDIYLEPTFSLIDTGYAFKHEQVVPPDFSTNYESFKFVIDVIIKIKTPKSHNSMISYTWYNWFPKIFQGDIKTLGELDEGYCRVIFKLFQKFEEYRSNFELRQLHIFNTLSPGNFEKLKDQNISLVAEAERYIASLSGQTHGEKVKVYNRYGGRRRNYYVSNRKQTKINKKHTRSMRRRKSQTRRRRRRHRSKSKHY